MKTIFNKHTTPCGTMKQNNVSKSFVANISLINSSLLLITRLCDNDKPIAWNSIHTKNIWREIFYCKRDAVFTGWIQRSLLLNKTTKFGRVLDKDKTILQNSHTSRQIKESVDRLKNQCVKRNIYYTLYGIQKTAIILLNPEHNVNYTNITAIIWWLILITKN